MGISLRLLVGNNEENIISLNRKLIDGGVGDVEVDGDLVLGLVPVVLFLGFHSYDVGHSKVITSTQVI